MLKKSAILASALILILGGSQADDAVKKPAVEEVKKEDNKEYLAPRSNKYTFSDKKVEDLTKEEAFNAGSYLNGMMVATKNGEDKDFDAKSFLLGMEEKKKNPTMPFDSSEWQKQASLYKELKKDNKEFTENFKINYFKTYGIYVANALPQRNFSIDIFIDGFKDKLTNKEVVLPQDKMKGLSDKLQAYFLEDAKIAGAKENTMGISFLEANKKKEGVVTLPSGLQYKIIKNGEGAVGIDGQTVSVHYVGTTVDGKEFDNSVKRGQPFEVVLPGQVIKGWQEALKLMNKGSKWQVFIPESLAYGAKGYGTTIKPFATLIFEMEIVDIANTVPEPTK
jgi:FKBP-type peptidyl-prolyl cis-trans isomerase FklB